jgi:hypothetical protein
LDRKIASSSRSGARAGRGFRYQDAATAYLCVLNYVGQLRWVVTPEAGDDVSLIAPSSRSELQVKSRRSPKGQTPTHEFASWLADLWRAHGATEGEQPPEIGILTDQPVAGIAATDLGKALGQVDITRVASLMRNAGFSDSDIQQLGPHTHLLHVQNPVTDASENLARHLDVNPAVAQILVRRIQSEIGRLVDEEQSGNERQGLSESDIGRLVDDTLAVVDLAAIELPVRQGLCEHVDFLTPVDDQGFYLGRDVVPGHIPAGLVVPRPSDIEEVLAVLQNERLALVTGPSGIGKSAVAWLSAYSSRNAIKWLRVRSSTTAADVPALIRFSEGLRADPRTPVGFVVDDIRGNHALIWDVLARELRHRPEIYALGTVREEELDVLSEAPPSALIRPRLMAELGEALWKELRDREQTSAAGWRESFEQSNGLLLEFVHMLTTGDRLPDVIQEQVDRRRKEGRHAELEVLRPVTFAAAKGGTTSISRLQTELGLQAGEMQNVLARLLDEHLIDQLDAETLGGLHQLRSEAIIQASHRIPPPTLKETAEQSLLTADVKHVAYIGAKTIHEELFDERTLQSILLRRLRFESTPEMLIAYLDAIRQVGIDAAAKTHLAILQAEGVPPGQQEPALQLALIKSDLGDPLAHEIQRALPQMIRVDVVDERASAMADTDEELLLEICSNVADSETAARLLGAMHGMDEMEERESVRSLHRLVNDLPMDKLSELLTAARGVSAALAQHLRDAALGNAEGTLERVRREVPWMTAVDYSEEERRVEAKWLFIGASAQDDPHELVVRECALLAGLFPEAGTIAVTAIDPTGEPAGFGDLKLADKAIPRKNIATPEQVRAHRAVIRSFSELATSETKTARLVIESQLLEETRQVLEELAIDWLRKEPLASQKSAKLNSLTERALAVAPTNHLPEDPLVKSRHVTDVGDAATLCRNICANALPRLFQDAEWSLAAFLFDTVSSLVGSILEADYWSLLEHEPADILENIRSILHDVHAVLCHQLAVSDSIRNSRRQASRQALHAAAELANAEGLERLQNRLDKVIGALQHIGYEARGFMVAASNPTGVCWPTRDVLIQVESDTLFEWMADVETIVDTVGAHFEDVRRVAIIPARGDLLLPHLAISGHRVQGYVLPFDAEIIPNENNSEVAKVPTLQKLEWLVDAALRLATLGQLESTRDLVGAEVEALEEAGAQFTEASQALLQAGQEDTSGFLDNVLEPIFQLLASEDLHQRLSGAIKGDDPDTMGLLVTIRLALAEWDIDPVSAERRLESALEAEPEAD